MADESNGKQTNNRILLSICIAIAALIWFVNKLSQETPWIISLQIEYELAEGYVISKKQVEELKVKLVGTGWSLWGINNELPSKITIATDHKLGNQNWGFDQLRQLVRLQADLPEDISIESITPPGLSISLAESASKCVPIYLPTELSFKSSYHQTQPIQLTPDSVCLTGPESILKSINKINLDTLQLYQLGANRTGKIDLQASIPELLRTNQKEIMYSLKVSEYTEIKNYVPIRVITKHPDSVEIFPKSALVTMEVPIEKYDQMEINSMGLYIKIPDKVISEDNTVTIKIPQNLPPWLKINSIQPPSVEYYFIEQASDTSISIPSVEID